MLTGRRGGAAACAVFVLVSSGSATARAITGGTPDLDAHPYVAMILLPGAGAPVCTGVLVSGRAGEVVLTDGHCLFHNGFRTGTGVRVSFASSWATGDPTIAGSFYVDPLYNPAESPDHDLAAVVLSQPPGVAPARLAAVGTSAALRGDVDSVGTGQPYEGNRRNASETVVGRQGQWLDLVPDDGNSCAGDSGGPDLLPGTDTVVALTDQGSCAADQDQRVDTAEAAALVAAAPQWPAHRPLVDSHLFRSTSGPRDVVSLEVWMSPLYAGETASRQQWTGGRWQVADRAKVNLAGLATFPLTAPRKGTARVRVVLPAAATHPAGMSPVSLLAR